MAIRTINSPGVEITERDLSQYTTGPVGTAVLVTGFAAKGRDYEPILLTSRSAWLQQFGEPSNEAERYFFNACMEVINQGGKLYACKLPYKNAALNKFTAKTYTVNVADLKSLSTVAEYVEAHQIDDVLAGNLSRFGELDPSADAAGLSTLFQAQDIKNRLDRFARAVEKYTTAIPYSYVPDDVLGQLNNSATVQDNWLFTPVIQIKDKLLALFDGESEFWTQVAKEGGITCNVSGEDYVVRSLQDIALSGDGFNFKGESESKSYTPETRYSMFIDAISEAFDGRTDSIVFQRIADPRNGINLNSIKDEFPEFENSALYKFFAANKPFFDKIDEISINDDTTKYHYKVPYMYCDDEKFNLATFFKADKIYDKIKDAEQYVTETNVAELVNKTIVLDNYLAFAEPSLSTIFDRPLVEVCIPEPPSSFIEYDISSIVSSDTTVYGWNEESQEADVMITNRVITREDGKIMSPLDDLRTAYKDLLESPAYANLIDRAMAGKYKDSDFAPIALQYYMDNTNVYNPEDKKMLRAAKSMNVLLSSVTPDDDPNNDAEELSTNFFKRYNGPNSASPELSSVQAVIDGAVKTLTYDFFYGFVKKFVDTETYSHISGYAYRSGDEDLIDTVSALTPEAVSSVLAYSEIKKADPTVKSYLTIDSERSEVELVDLETIDGYATGETPVRTNRIVIVDKTRGTLGTAFTKAADGTQKELVGVIPVITTAANALYVQALLETGESGISRYNAISRARTLAGAVYNGSPVGPFDIKEEDAAIPFASDNAGTYTVSQLVASSFPSIHFTADGTLDRQNLKKIGVVVLRAFLDPGEGNKVNYDIVEAYAGELDKNAVDPNTGASTFIDTLVNSQSEYIELYSNCFNQTATRERYSKTDLFVVPPQKAGDLGFYQFMTKKDISLTDSILKALPLIWEKNEDINEKQIDIVCDAGVSNIAQYIKSVFNGGKGEYDPASEAASLFKLRSKEDTKTWRAVLDMYDNFCKKIRKDCMFVADGPRPFCLVGNKKIVRPSKPSNTIDASILPMLKFITGVNTNYGAGYCDWFQKSDEFSGDYFWCPPSIQAMGVYLNTDINFDYWMAPAGLNRGIVSALDVAFNPTQRQSDEIYPKCWNYARNYPNDGIVLEGQRTFQTKATALDRVNVRRAMLRFERIVYELARWFVYENNTMYTRQRLYDAIDGVFKEIKGQGGMIDYKIICDESINTPEVIDRNELRVKIGIKPIKSAEFILVEFNVLRQGGSWSEML